jgi:hypothetical protein
MPERELVTRDSLRRELAVNAATKPLPIVAAAAVAVAAFLLGVPWLLPIALGIYVALAATTFLDPEEADRVGRETYARAREVWAPKPPAAALAEPIAALVERARAEERKITGAIDESELPLVEVSVEVKALTGDLERSARRAQRLWEYRQGESAVDVRRRLEALRVQGGGSQETVAARRRAEAALEDRLRVGAALDAELERFLAEMEHLVATLGVVHGQVVRMSVSDDGREEQLAGELRDLRGRVAALADGMRDAVPKDG